VQNTLLTISALASLLIARIAMGGPDFDERQWRNLVGLRAISNRLSIQVNFHGVESLGLDMSRLEAGISQTLAKEGLLLEASVNLPSLLISTTGRSSDGKEGEYRIQLTLSARVQSPFMKDKHIQAIIWQAEQSDSQTLEYNPETRKLDHPSACSVKGWKVMHKASRRDYCSISRRPTQNKRAYITPLLALVQPPHAANAQTAVGG
jgi:hypothetical protein